jgi:hypothetical protein
MKRLIAALSLALLAIPALAQPSEQDRQTTTISESVWETDHNFVSPAQ